MEVKLSSKISHWPKIPHRYEQMDKEENLDDLHFKYEKAFKEATTKAPIRLDAKTYDGLNITGTWQKFWTHYFVKNILVKPSIYVRGLRVKNFYI